MSPRSISLLVLAGAVAGSAAAGPVLAAPKPKPKPKPISETYTANAFPPDPTPFLASNAPNPANPNAANCNGTIAQSQDLHPFKAPAPGVLQIDLTGFQGDWALGLRNKAGKNLADSDQAVGDAIDRPEKIKYKVKAAMDLTIAACNFLGGPTATVKYTFTFS